MTNLPVFLTSTGRKSGKKEEGNKGKVKKRVKFSECHRKTGKTSSRLIKAKHRRHPTCAAHISEGYKSSARIYQTAQRAWGFYLLKPVLKQQSPQVATFSQSAFILVSEIPAVFSYTSLCLTVPLLVVFAESNCIEPVIGLWGQIESFSIFWVWDSVLGMTTHAARPVDHARNVTYPRWKMDSEKHGRARERKNRREAPAIVWSRAGTSLHLDLFSSSPKNVREEVQLGKKRGKGVKSKGYNGEACREEKSYVEEEIEKHKKTRKKKKNMRKRNREDKKTKGSRKSLKKKINREEYGRQKEYGEKETGGRCEDKQEKKEHMENNEGCGGNSGINTLIEVSPSCFILFPICSVEAWARKPELRLDVAETQSEAFCTDCFTVEANLDSQGCYMTNMCQLSECSLIVHVS
ncbi:hypothetical protein RRG08_058930 [Elysia crispata]|uniref:Uncharacterized protein n=1 Tax=Elysia crispata TaxID=231223 RepID=A0AAE0XSU1_9GAST|nr:hypothetical protein RRG08_058930 [Elysia crispata]